MRGMGMSSKARQRNAVQITNYPPQEVLSVSQPWFTVSTYEVGQVTLTTLEGMQFHLYNKNVPSWLHKRIWLRVNWLICKNGSFSQFLLSNRWRHIQITRSSMGPESHQYLGLFLWVCSFTYIFQKINCNHPNLWLL